MSTDAKAFYRPELDALRFVAFLAVFVHHALPQGSDVYVARGVPAQMAELLAATARSGGLGVELFFLLSSFLITELLLRERDATGKVDPKAFLVRRILRIWPLFYAFLIGTWLFEGLQGRWVLAYGLLAGNWGCAFWDYPKSVVAPLWSVSVEEQFYLTWPWIVAFAGPKRLKWVLAALAVAACGGRLALIGVGLPHPFVWCATVTHLDAIAAGAALALWFRHRGEVSLSAPASVGLVVGGFALWIGLERVWPLTQQTWAVAITYPGYWIAALMMLVGVYGSGGRWKAVLASAPLRYLGKISYGLYVFHLLGFTAANAVSASYALVVPLAFAATVAMAAVSYAVLEKPFLKLKARFTVVESRGV